MASFTLGSDSGPMKEYCFTMFHKDEEHSDNSKHFNLLPETAASLNGVTMSEGYIRFKINYNTKEYIITFTKLVKLCRFPHSDNNMHQP